MIRPDIRVRTGFPVVGALPRLSLTFRRHGHLGLFLVALAGYVTAASLLVFRGGAIVPDAWARVGNAAWMIIGRDPHFAAIGFVWNPLPSLAALPLIAIRDLWPPLVTAGFAGNIVSAVFMAGAVVVMARIAADLGVRRLAAWILVALFALHPMLILYGANGMSEAPFLFFLLLATRYLITWWRTGSTYGLTAGGLALSLAYLTRYEAMAAAAGALIVIGGCSFLRSKGAWRVRRSWAAADLLVAGLPVVFAVFGWAVASWMITGNPFETLTSVYGSSSQFALAGSSIAAAVGRGADAFWYALSQIVGLAPGLPILVPIVGVLAVLRRRAEFVVPMAIFGSVLAFSVLTTVSGSSFGWLRFSITAIPLSFVLALLVLVPAPIVGMPAWTLPSGLLAARRRFAATIGRLDARVRAFWGEFDTVRGRLAEWLGVGRRRVDATRARFDQRLLETERSVRTARASLGERWLVGRSRVVAERSRVAGRVREDARVRVVGHRLAEERARVTAQPARVRERVGAVQDRIAADRDHLVDGARRAARASIGPRIVTVRGRIDAERMRAGAQRARFGQRVLMTRRRLASAWTRFDDRARLAAQAHVDAPLLAGRAKLQARLLAARERTDAARARASALRTRVDERRAARNRVVVARTSVAPSVRYDERLLAARRRIVSTRAGVRTRFLPDERRLAAKHVLGVGRARLEERRVAARSVLAALPVRAQARLLEVAGELIRRGPIVARRLLDGGHDLIVRMPMRATRLALGIAVVAIVAASLPVGLATMSDPRAGREEADQVRALTSGYDPTMATLHPSEVGSAAARYLDRLGLPDGSVIVDVAVGFPIVLQSSHPRQFVITPDRDFERILADPATFSVRYLLVPSGAGYSSLDAVGRAYPGLFNEGAGFARLVAEFGSGALAWRLYEID